MKKIITALKFVKTAALAAILCVSLSASAQIITNAYDVGTNYVTAGNYFTGDNQGSGFGPWTITENGGGQLLVNEDTAQFGRYVFSLTNQTATGLTTANRPFSNPLPVGSSFSFRFRLNHLDHSATNGFRLQDASGNVLFSYYHKAGDNNDGWFIDARGSGVATNFPYNFQGFSSLTFTLNSATNYTFSAAGKGSFNGLLSNAPITQVTFFRANAGSVTTDGENFDFNALTITTLGSKPVFTVQPANSAAIAGGSVTLGTAATSNLGTPHYQWYFTNGPIAGATGTNLLLANISATNAGAYFVVATNTAGMSTSSVAVVTVIPFGYTNAYDIAASYGNVYAGNQGFGFGPWALSTSGGGSYINGSPVLFAIWNGVANGSSTAVRPFNAPLPVGGSFIVQLQMNSLQAGNTNAFELQDANGNVLFSYWHEGSDAELGDGHYLDAGVLDGTATNFWFHVNQVDSFVFTLTSATTYTFTDLNSGAGFSGTLSGAPITQATVLRANGPVTPPNGQDLKFNGLTILTPNGNPPPFVTQPQYNGGLVGSTISLQATASDAFGPVHYQWYFGGAQIAGETNAALILANAGLSSSGSYSLVAANAFGSSTSRVSVVTVYVETNRLLAYEGFGYDALAIDGVTQNGGLGWNGAWLIVGGTGNYINPGSLLGDINVPTNYDSLSTGNSYRNYDSSRTGRNLDLSTNGAFAARGYLDASGNIGAPGKTLYVSFVMQPDLTVKFYEFEFHLNDLNDGGRIAGIGNDNNPSTNNVFFRKPSQRNGPFVDLGVGDSLSDPTYGNHAVDFYVLRIDYQPGHADNVTIYRNPTSLTEPGTPTVALTNVGNMSFNAFSLGAYGTPVVFDEIRVGQTWADAIGLPGETGMMQPVRQGNGWSIRFAGNPAFAYRVQRATSLTDVWTDLGTATPAENGIGTVADPNPPADGAFYRTVTP